MNESVTLEQELAAAYAENETVSAAVETPVTTPENAAPEAVDSGRDEKGRFKSKATETATDATVQPNSGNPAEQATTPEQAAAPKIARAPDSWSVAAKAKFATLDPEIQQEIQKREQDIFKGIEQYKEGHQFAQTMQKAVAPYMATIQSVGATPDQAVQHLLSLDHQLRYGSPEVKLNTLAQIAQSFGIDPRQLATEQPQVDPTVAALKQELAQLKQQFTSNETQAKTAEQRYIDSEIEKFANDPSNTYYANVVNDMAALLQAGAATDMKDAYDKACWANPEIRSILLRQQAEEAEKKRLAEAAQKAQLAKRASFDIQGTGSTAPNPERKMTLEEELSSLFG